LAKINEKSNHLQQQSSNIGSIEYSIFQDLPFKFKKFHHTNDIYKFIDNLNKKKFVEVSTIGHTKQGTPLKVIHIKPDNNKTNNDIIWIDGGILVFTLFKQIFINLKYI